MEIPIKGSRNKGVRAKTPLLAASLLARAQVGLRRGKKAIAHCPRLTGRHWDSLLGSPLKSLEPPRENGSLRFPDVSCPLVEGRASGSPPRWILTGALPVDRDDLASDRLLMVPRSPRASPIVNSESGLLRFILLAVLRLEVPAWLRATCFSLSASLCSSWPLRTSSSSARFF